MHRKIVIASNTSWSIYNFRLNLARMLKRSGYEVIIVAPKDKYSDIVNEEFEYHDVYINNKGTNPIEDIRTTFEFYKLYGEIKPHAVLNYTIKPNIYGTIAASLLGIKSINNIAGLGTLFVKQNFVTKLAKYLYKYSQKKANKVFFQNRDDFKLFTGEKLIDKEKCDILPGSGIDTDEFKPQKTQNKNKAFKFLLISRMLWDKGIGEYIEAARIIKSKYKNIDFQLLGFLEVKNRTSIKKEQITKWVNEGIVDYLGTSDNVQEIISQANCIVLPSFYREGTPRTLLESASMEKPIITTDNVGCRDVVDDEVNGFLCEVKDVKDLANKMEKMINLSDEKRIAMGKMGREKMIKEFDEKIVIDRYLKIINEIL